MCVESKRVSFWRTVFNGGEGVRLFSVFGHSYMFADVSFKSYK